jgi:histone H3/H4
MGDVLVVASKVKKLIREKSGMNTSAEVLETLSRKVEALCTDAIERAKADGRKTVKGRDFPEG